MIFMIKEGTNKISEFEEWKHHSIQPNKEHRDETCRLVLVVPREAEQGNSLYFDVVGRD